MIGEAPVQIPATTEIAALRRCRFFSCDDLGEARDRIARILQPHVLLPVGSGARRPHHMDVIELPGIRINAISFGEARIEVPPLAGYHVVIFCLSGHGWMRSGATETEISPRRAVTCSAGRSLEGLFSSDCEQLVLRIDQCAMEAHTGLRDVILDPVIDIGNRSLRPWLMHLDALIASPELLRMVQSDRKIATNYTSLLLRLLVMGHGRDSKQSTQRPIPASVYRAESFISAHASEAITLQDIAAAARTPVRTLSQGFRQFRNTSPMQFLRSVRLTESRDCLVRDGSSSIASVALGCGFNNLGRFSREYAKKFGELPSETRASRGIKMGRYLSKT